MPENDGKWSSEDLRTWLAGMAIGLALLAVVAIVYAFGFNRGQENVTGINVKTKTAIEKTAAGAPTPETAESTAAAPAGTPSKADIAAGKKLFVDSCGGCHTLKDAKTSGTVGPDLDTIKPNMDLVLTAIKIGGTGNGAMPKNLYTGKDAQQVADYVSDVAGK